MMRRLLAAALAVLCLLALLPTAVAAESFRARVVLPYYHVWKTDVPDADDRFTYRWTVVTPGAPTPQGVTSEYWDWNLKGNVEGNLTLELTFDQPGAYDYRLAAYVPNPVKGYVYEPRTYLLTVLVVNKTTPGSGLTAEWTLLNERSGAKVDRIDLDPSYTSGETPTQTPTEKPTEKPTQQPTEKTTEKKGGSSGGSSGGNSGSSAAKTGDSNRIRSMATILSVSGLLLAYLLYEELRQHRRGKQK